MANSPAVVVTIADGVGHLQLNRPEVANAIDLATARALEDAVRSLGEDDRVAAILVSGSGPRFCAGGDAASMASATDQPGYVLELANTLDAVLQHLSALSKPVICAVQGAVAGAGIAAMLSCDITIAAPRTKFVMAYSAIGLTPDCGVSWLLPRAIGQPRALEFALTGRVLTAEEALSWGLIAEIADDPLTRAHKLALALAEGPAAAFGQTRRLLRDAWSTTRAETGREEARTIAAAVTGTYAQTALRTFLPEPKTTHDPEVTQ